MAKTMNLCVLTGLSAALLVQSAIGQQRGGSTAPPPASTGGTAPGNTGTRPGNTTPLPSTQPNSTNPIQTRPILISGRVMMDDGSEVPRNLAIERACGGSVRIEGHTDSKGYFNVELGSRNTDALQDASTGGFDDLGQPGFGQPNNSLGGNSSFGGNSLNPQSLMGCELRVRLAGYQSQEIDLSMRQPFDNPDIGTILMHRLGASQGTTVSATTLQAPKNARKAFQKGLDLEKKKKLEEAGASFQQAVDAYPKYAEAWSALGQVQASQGQMDAAHKSFDQAIQADPKYVPPYIQISTMEMAAQHWQALADVTDKAMRLDPFTFPQAFFFNAVANYNLHHADVAEQSARQAQKLDTQHRIPQVSHLLGVILADRHDFAGAAAQMRDYLKFAPQANNAAAVRAQLEGLEKQAGAAATATEPRP